MTSILLSVPGFDPEVWLAALNQHAPDRTIETAVTDANRTDINYAIIWKRQPDNLLSDLPNLKVIFSAGAGVDHIVTDETIPDVPVVRIVAGDLTNRMSEYIVWQALDHLRQGPRYRKQQADGVWFEDRHQVSADEVTVGIMGIGALGLDAARKLQTMGFHVLGWSRNPKQIDGIETFDGSDGLSAMLGKTDILVCLLPLTAATRRIINAALLAKLKKESPLGGPILINAGRGGLQVEADILAALEGGTLKAASLDVFETEPLPTDSPLWHHPAVTITPHAAAASSPKALVPEILKQIAAFENGEPLQNVVDRKAGY